MRPHSHQMRRRGRAPIEVLVFLGAITLLVALTIPAIQQAREAARRTSSRNNLHNIGLALHNYHDVHECLPPGGTVLADGQECHGWFAQICPYLDASNLYHQIDFDRPWNDSVNGHLFWSQYPSALIPGVSSVATSEGYALNHYSANSSVFFRNSSVGLSDYTGGTTNGWFAAEVASDYEPWGSPFNWRAWDQPLNAGADSFGHWEGGTYFLLADGSVRFVSEQESEGLRRSLTGGLPVPLPADVERPERDWQYVTSSNTRKSTFVALDDLEWDGLVLKVCYDANGSTHTATIEPRGKWSDRSPDIGDLRRVVETYPDTRVLLVGVPIDEPTSELLTGFSRLEVLRVPRVSTEPAVIANLQKLGQLQELIIGSLSAESTGILTGSLPSVVIDVRSPPAGGF